MEITPFPAYPLTLVELLQERAACRPDQRIYTFLADGEKEEASFTYAALDRQARSIAAQLQRAGDAGDRVLLLYPPGLEYIAAFFGCLYAGMIAVPAYPPRLNRPDPRLQAMVADAQVAIALTTTDIFSSLERYCIHIPGLRTLRCIATDHLWDGTSEGWHEPVLNPETVAFLQYTSGSTSVPRGVIVRHENLIHNLQLIQHCFEHTPASRGVSWLPPYHDMGLIGGILQPLFVGFPVVLMSPMAFLQAPLRWLEAISRYKATTSGGPNFAYDICVRKITAEQRAKLDLSSWDLAFNGAESVRAETLARFADTFAPCGFRREAFYPCYGLAEATLIASGGRKSEAPIVRAFQVSALEQNHAVAPSSLPDADRGARLLVSCGRELGNQQIAIVDPAVGTRCAADQVGEIWLTGASVAKGYWNQPEERTRTFGVYMDTGEGPFLRTGDLGFLHDGELFVTGRLKDLIIIWGRNHYPQDIELTACQSHSALAPGGGAAFSIDVDGAEQLVIVHELDRHARHVDIEQVIYAIRQAVAEQHYLQVYAVVLISSKSMPKTSSGKIQRHACRAGFLTGTLRVIGEWRAHAPETNAPALERTYVAPQTDLEQTLATIWQEVLQIDAVGLDDNFFDLGGRSLLLGQVQERVQAALQREISMIELFTYPNLRSLATYLSQGVVVPTPQLRSDGGQRQQIILRQKQRWMAIQGQKGVVSSELTGESEHEYSE